MDVQFFNLSFKSNRSVLWLKAHELSFKIPSKKKQVIEGNHWIYIDQAMKGRIETLKSILLK